MGGLRIRQSPAILCPAGNAGEGRDRVFQWTAHHPRSRHIRVLAQALAVASRVSKAMMLREQYGQGNSGLSSGSCTALPPRTLEARDLMQAVLADQIAICK